MTGVKQYLHKYVEEPGPKVVFGDNSLAPTEGYGSVNCNGIVFTRIAYVNGLKYNLISVSQLCDAKYIVQFDDKRGTIFNANKEGPTLADLQMLIDEESEEDLVDFEDDTGLMDGDDMDTEDVTPTETPATEQHTEETEPSSSNEHELDDTRPITEKVLVEFGEYNNEWLYFQLEDANDDRHLEAAASYADFRGSMEEKQTELKTAFASTDDKSTLTNIQQEFKDDPILVTKLTEFMDSHKTTSAALSSLPALFKEVDFPALKSQQVSILSTLQAQEAKLTTLSSGYEQLTNKHNELVNCYTDKLAKLSETQQALSTDLSSLKTETSEIKGMVYDIFKLLQASQTSPVQASPAPQAQAPAPQHTKDDSQATTTSVPTPTTEIITEAVPIRSFMLGSSTEIMTTPVITEATTTTTKLPESSFSTPPQADKGKSIKVTEDSPPRLVPATRKVHRDPDEPILFEVTLHNGKVFRGTNEEVAAALEEDDKLKAELLMIKETNQTIKGEQFLKLQADMIKEANQKAMLNAERKQRNYERYVCSMTKTKGEGAITDIIIHPYKKNEPIAVTIERGLRVHKRSGRRGSVVAVKCKAQDTTDDNDSKGEEPTESLFMKELKRRGMTPTSLLEESWSTLKDENITYKEEDGGFSNRNAVSTDLEKSLLNQRERSISLNSEGLEGLIPRAKVLLTLGGTYFLAFWPLILVTVASFSAVYLYFGPKFVHDATTRQVYLPKYVDPYELLEDQRISETAPRLN
ncbi:hypothetical protein CTI12_AA062920 [Artemisia annua]|uniref:Retrovirus-related Pol polyprotein from transposon TNT 1-94-like beta-barrel domain-containing protein n=1 Tax=Artemisia annua TaxID=35608 RepID=A0A2U1Q820_ARTAN|nr:hypothetical protein CTI12_AA062920 [Artemisia annua]